MKQRWKNHRTLWLNVLICLSIVMLGSVAAVNLSWALQPPRPGEIEGLKQSGLLQKRLDFAEKLGNHKVDPYLLKKAMIRTQRRLLEAQGKPTAELDALAKTMTLPPGRQGMPTTGAVRVLAILIDFNDHNHNNSRHYIHSRLFEAGDSADAPYESLSTYYNRASYGRLDLSSGNTLDWYTTAYDRSTVPETTTGREDLIKEVLTHYDNNGHDFSQYDNDNDGTVDYFIVIWAGPHGDWATFWWGFQHTFWDSAYTLDGVNFGDYSWQWEAWSAGGTFDPRVVMHETGHALGLPDYYDYDATYGPCGGVGGLDMMHGNKGDHGAFSKWLLDWITPTVVANGSREITLNPSGTSRDAVMIWPGATAGDIFTEFFMVQNRNRAGNDDTPEMPGEGLTIWHVDAHLNSWGDFRNDNSYTDHKLLRLMEADGLEEIEAGCHQLTVAYREDGTQLDKLLISSDMAYTPTGEGDDGDGQIWLEAEDANDITSPLSTVYDAGAADDFYITVDSGNNSLNTPPIDGRATYQFMVNSGGQHKIWGRAIAPSGGDDSFWVKMDDNSWIKWNQIAGSNAASWTWDDVHDHDNGNQVLYFDLSNGEAADAEDYYNTGQSFGPSSQPNSNRYDGGRSGISVSNIRELSSQITATYTVGTGPVEDLNLTSMCSDEPDKQRRWRVRNSNQFEVEVRWEVYKTTQQGSYLAPAGDSYFFTDTISGPNTTIIRWLDEDGREQSKTKASSGERCGPAKPLEVIYRAHVKKKGWLKWVSNGAVAGTTGKNRRMEAVQVYLKNAPAGMRVKYRAHVKGKGWMKWVFDGATAGTTGQNRRMEAVQIKLVNAPAGYGITYKAHVKKKGWLKWVSDGATAGTTGQRRRMEALKIKVSTP